MDDYSGGRMSMNGALDVLARRRSEQVVVSTMTALRPWRELAGSDRDLICVGFMGGASTFGLGVALARPEVGVWTIDGDGSLAMQLGSLVTIANAEPARFLHVVMHNGVYDTSGAQPLPAEGRISFAALAAAAGYAEAIRFDDAEVFDAAIDDLLEVTGPVMVELITEPAGTPYTPGPPQRTPETPALATNWPAVRDALKA